MHHQAAGAAPLVQEALRGVSGVFTGKGELSPFRRSCFRAQAGCACSTDLQKGICVISPGWFTGAFPQVSQLKT